MTQPYVDSDSPVILWFRSDLRLRDHAGVASAVASGRPIIPVYIYDDAIGTRPLGAASKWWLHRSLKSLDEDLAGLGSRLIILSGATRVELDNILEKTRSRTVICSNTFDPIIEKIDDELAETLKLRHVDLERHNTTLLAPPGIVRTKGGTPFKVFTPFKTAMTDNGFLESHPPHGLLSGKWRAPSSWPHSVGRDSLGLNDTRTASGHDWASGFDRFTPGEQGARDALSEFVDDHLADYAEGRDRADKEATSHLSPHLRFGEIHPQRILYEVAQASHRHRSLGAAAEKFRSELAWREFCYGLLGQQPKLDHVNFRYSFDRFPWLDDDTGFHAWCRGETGYELVDAGMRELWQTGYMHNRVRMVCASFLTKHLLIDWRRGEQWFWDCLLDADPANNPANWQWVAGCGADAAPYFRIFNPISQAEKFDPAGLYRTRYIAGYSFRKPARGKSSAGDVGKSIVDHAFARERALEAYRTLRVHSEETADHDVAD